jgi:superfamily II DNA or RNA helicase
MANDPAGVPFEQWSLECAEADKKVVNLLQTLESESMASATATSIVVPHIAAARLSADDAELLRLPTPIPFDLDVKCEGTLDESSSRFRLRWVATGGRPVLGLTRVGCIASRSETRFRIPEPFYTIISELEQYNNEPPITRDERFLAWGRVQEKLGDTSGVDVDGYLSGIRVFRASSFTLRIDSGIDGDLNVAPILLRAVEKVSETDVTFLTQAGDEGTEELLPPKYQSIFESRFKQFREARSCYPLDSGYFVVLDESLRKALETVRTARDADSSTRREYAKNPRAFIREAVDEDCTDDDLERLFSETDSYSDRVTGLGLWQPKSLPWLIQTGQSWLPPDFEVLDSGGRATPAAIAGLEDLGEKIAEAIASGEPFVKVAGREIPATQASLDSLEELVKECRASQVSDHAVDEKSVLLIEDNLESVGYASMPKSRRASPFSVPAMSSTLKPHQIECLIWLQDQWRSGSPGGILADDMGLGKTLEALCFLRWLQDEMGRANCPRQPFLVVAPTGLLKNWEDEAELHLGSFGLGVLHRAYGSGLRQVRRAGSRSLDREPLRRAGWVLTTYETLRDYQQEFALIPFSTIVFDEAQKIKNPAILLTEASKAMRAEFTLAMTGTPVENRLADLWCIADTVHPASLGDLRRFVKRYEVEEPAVMAELRDRVMTPQKSLPAMMLRRMKADKLPGLPKKHEYVLERPMSSIQADAYTNRLEEIGNERPGWMLETLQAIRSVSLHPSPDAAGSDQSFIEMSARFAIAFEVLDRVYRSGEKALIFLEFKSLQAQLAGLIQRRYMMPRSPMIINGEVSGSGRQDRVRTFQAQAGFDVMILSPKAGGVGLTLTAANHVIHLSRWWNPAVEDQCTDRVYRIGQERAVHVYYPLAIHPGHPDSTFDKLLHNLIDRKRSVSRNLLAPPLANESDLKTLFEQTIHPV